MATANNLRVSARAALIIKTEAKKLRSNEAIALRYMPTFTNADGTTVAEFFPGYTIDRVKQQDLSDPWMLARLPGGTAIYFVPRFSWRDSESYLLDRESGYTFSIRPDRGS